MSKVIHIRISNDTIYTCLHILKQSNIDTTNMPLATIVRRYLDGSCENYRQQTQLTMPDNLEDLVSNLTEEQPTDITMPTVGFTEVSGSDQDMMENIRLAMQQSEEGHTKPDVGISEVVNTEQVLPPAPWLSENITSWERIKDMSPKDALIESAEGNEPLQRAVQCVYSELSTTEWGGQHAMMLVQKALLTIKLYFNTDEDGKEDEL